MRLDCLNKVHQLIDIFPFPHDAGPEHSDELEPDLNYYLEHMTEAVTFMKRL